MLREIYIGEMLCDGETAVFQVADGEDRQSKLCIWSHPGDDVTGMVGRCEKVVTTSEKVGTTTNTHLQQCIDYPVYCHDHVSMLC